MGIMQSENAAAPAEGKITDPILQKVEDGIEAKVENKGQYQAILLSGLQIMFGKNTRHLLEQVLDQEGEPVAKIASGIARLVVTIYQQSDGKMEMPYAVPAGIVLAMHALDLAHKIGLVPEITNELVAQVTQATSKAILDAFGIDREKVQQAVRGQAPAEQQEQPAAEPAGGLMMSGA